MTAEERDIIIFIPSRSVPKKPTALHILLLLLPAKFPACETASLAASNGRSSSLVFTLLLGRTRWLGWVVR